MEDSGVESPICKYLIWRNRDGTLQTAFLLLDSRHVFDYEYKKSFSTEELHRNSIKLICTGCS